jgi:hypothetical protein
VSRQITVEILGDSRSLEKAFQKSAKDANKFGKGVEQTGKKTKGIFGGLGKSIGMLGVGGGLVALGGAAKAAFGEMADSQKVSAQTAAVLKSTGKAAGVSAKQVDDLSGALMKKSGVDDEAIKSGENLLLTFTNVRNEAGKGNDVFSQATTTMLDMSVALGQDMKSSAVQLGKALNDPVKGISALSRVGVSFTADQKAMIASLVKSGDTMGAQKIILAELRKEFGGSAAAAGKTLPGKLNILRETLLNLGGTIAEKLAPKIINLVDHMTKWLESSKNQKTMLDTVDGVVKAVTGTLKVLTTTFGLLSKAVGGNKHAVELLVAAYATFKVAKIAGNVADLAGKFGLLSGKTDTAAGSAKSMSGAMGKVGLAGAVALAAWELSNMIRKIPGWDKAMQGLGATAYDAAAKIGLVHDPMAQFAGKANLTQDQATAIRSQAYQLEQGGMTGAQAAGVLAARNPGVARYDIDTLAGVHSAAGTLVTVNGDLNINGVQNPRQLQEQLQKMSRGQPSTRRG